MKPRAYALAVTLGIMVLVVASAVRADDVTYTFTGTLQSPVNGTTSISGTFVMDTTTDQIASWNLFDGSLEYTPLNSTASREVLTSTNAAYLIGLNTFCGPAGSQCGFITLGFDDSAGFSALTFDTSLANNPFSLASPGNDAVCFGVAQQTLPGGFSYTCGDGLTAFGAGVAGLDASGAFYQSGSATVTPEPSSAFLLSTGLLGLMGMGLYKRRLT